MSREHRVPIMMSDEEIAFIDDWRFRNHIATRSEAIRRLCQRALEADAAWLKRKRESRRARHSKYLKKLHTAEQEVG